MALYQLLSVSLLDHDTLTSPTDSFKPGNSVCQAFCSAHTTSATGALKPCSRNSTLISTVWGHGLYVQLAHVRHFNGETTALFQLCCWRKQISESAQDVKMNHKHSEEEGKRGHWLGRRRKRRKRKAVVIRAEHYSKCRRMQVVPMVLDEVLLSCWATKQFIYKTVTAYRHGRGNCYAYCSFFATNQSMPHFLRLVKHFQHFHR